MIDGAGPKASVGENMVDLLLPGQSNGLAVGRRRPGAKLKHAPKDCDLAAGHAADRLERRRHGLRIGVIGVVNYFGPVGKVKNVHPAAGKRDGGKTFGDRRAFDFEYPGGGDRRQGVVYVVFAGDRELDPAKFFGPDVGFFQESLGDDLRSACFRPFF